MNKIFDLCVRLLIALAAPLGITYKEINVLLFVIIWPVITLALIVIVILQQSRIRRLRGNNEEFKQVNIDCAP